MASSAGSALRLGLPSLASPRLRASAPSSARLPFALSSPPFSSSRLPAILAAGDPSSLSHKVSRGPARLSPQCSFASQSVASVSSSAAQLSASAGACLGSAARAALERVEPRLRCLGSCSFSTGAPTAGDEGEKRAKEGKPTDFPLIFDGGEERLSPQQVAEKEQLIKELTQRLSGPLVDADGNVPTGAARPIAIEVDGPTHFYANSTRYTAYTKLKHRLLTRMGYKVLHVPYFEWRRLRGQKEREEYMRRKLMEEPTEWLDPEDEKFYNERMKVLRQQYEEEARRAAGLEPATRVPPPSHPSAESSAAAPFSAAPPPPPPPHPSAQPAMRIASPDEGVSTAAGEAWRARPRHEREGDLPRRDLPPRERSGAYGAPYPPQHGYSQGPPPPYAPQHPGHAVGSALARPPAFRPPAYAPAVQPGSPSFHPGYPAYQPSAPFPPPAFPSAAPTPNAPAAPSGAFAAAATASTEQPTSAPATGDSVEETIAQIKRQQDELAKMLAKLKSLEQETGKKGPAADGDSADAPAGRTQ
ncbi:RAP domain-containing protein [Besnoitia besnoiti]|uniref:RAP domain-containing protein n=1 Tax=Besnoitia besnoiti TaxID=94643 RepID=A0A2A9MF31_BESBE|nr:RAP domain-containing protein [Besnoitia besnoiti]PFH34861.1 RAP domain-containing protein [Besnoitia besnoiti]